MVTMASILILLGITVMAPRAQAIDCGALGALPGIGNSCQPDKAVDLKEVIYAIINYLVSIIGAVIVLVIIISGVQLAASAGNPDAIKKAKEHILNAVISLVLLISMYAILSLIGIVT